MEIKGKIAWITGGSKGIGLAIAKSLLSAGISVCITARSEAELKTVSDQLNDQYEAKTLAMVCDVRNYVSCEKVVKSISEHFGQLDIVVANAGVGHFSSIENMSPEAWNETIDINLTGVFNTIKPSINLLKDSKGYIFTIASLAGTNFFPTGSAYNASKFGLVGFSQAIMLDLRAHGIKVSTLMPGSVSSYFNNHIPSDKDAWKIQPEDIGQLLVDLLKMHPRTLPSKVEIRPSIPPSKA